MSATRLSTLSSVADFLHPEGQARLELKPPGPITGFVDGAWWPRSNDLAREAVPLLAAVETLRGTTLRVNYDLATWTNTEHAIMTGGVRVHLDGFNGWPSHRVLLTDKNNQNTALLVIPPDTDLRSATDSMRRAASAGNQDDTDSLLAPVGNSEPPDRTGDEVAIGEWETEGGPSAGTAPRAA